MAPAVTSGLECPTHPDRIHSNLRRVFYVPVSVANSQVVYDAIKGVGVRMVSALPETWLVHLIRMADEDPEMTLVRLAKE